MPHPTSIKFGTDGWRAVIADTYTFANVRRCAAGLGRYVLNQHQADRGLVIGYDTRFGSHDFAATAASTLTALNIPVYLCNRPTPTPTTSYTIIDQQAAGCAIITASHNPGNYNGFKFRPEYAGSARPEITKAIEALIPDEADSLQMPLAEARSSGLLTDLDPWPAYRAKLESLANFDRVKAAGLNVVVDAMHGAGGGLWPDLLAGGQTTITELRGEPNPNFPGMHNPEPLAHNLHPLAATIVQNDADIGLAPDGDADRIGVLDEHGQFVNPLQLYALLLLYTLEVRGLRGPIVRTITCTTMANKLAAKYNLPVYETPIGFKYVGPKMVDVKAIYGGEESGGYAFGDHIPERDGFASGLFLLDFMALTGRTMRGLVDYLFEQIGPHYYDRIDLTYDAAQREAVLKRMQQAKPDRLAGLKVTGLVTVDGFRFDLEDGGWLIVRFSGTEPLLRIYCETTHGDRVQELLDAGRTLAGI
ncbi:MAG TPA: phosphoglucomutase/phosphomannomutase family protein [Anaerolineae bacterium]|nr:phosphoglucomutase/phosphomannomutase family protein [Anaerolineae bacterium]HRV91551.1 phosphoglucomutase/phosphomannomutase family protein [Anaerolineae bacterium]